MLSNIEPKFKNYSVTVGVGKVTESVRADEEDCHPRAGRGV